VFLNNLAISLDSLFFQGFLFGVMPVFGDTEGEVSVLQINVDGFDELPITVTASDEQLLCISKLFHKDEIKPDLVNELNKMMLQLSVNIPLSSFGMIDDTYILFGAMGIATPVDEIAKELVIQAENSLECLESFSEFLK